ncbi:MAG: putative repeat protein [Bacteroidetes bacterium]|nr:putative repeat protein [Bacteroidota bacterium]
MKSTRRNIARSLVLFCCYAIVSSPALLSQVNVRLPEVAARPGSDVSIPVNVDDLTGRKVTAFELVISCDTSVVHLKGTDQEGTLSEGLTMFANNSVAPFSAGKMKIVCASAQPISGAGVLVKILANVRKSGTTTLALSDVIMNAGVPQVRTENGVLRVQASRGKKSGARK